MAAVLLLSGCGDNSDALQAPDDQTPQATQTTTDDSVNSTVTATSNTIATTTPSSGEETEDELFPDVVAVSSDLAADGSWTFSVTLSSPYDSAERYADAWRVMSPDGEVFGERILAHDHANEQPFTRSQSGIIIPDDVDEVVVQGRDQVSGWGGATITHTLERN